VLEGWTVDQRIEIAMSHLNCPAGDRNIETLSGGEKRRVAMCRAIVSRPDFLILDEPTNHLDPESIEWLAEFLRNFTARFSSSRMTAIFSTAWSSRMIELCDGKFWSHDGNYTEYLLDKAERQAADATVEHKRQMFLKKELAWVRQGPRAQRSKQKDRFERYYDEAAKSGPSSRRRWNSSFRRRRNSATAPWRSPVSAWRSPGKNYFPVSISHLKTASASASAGATASANPRCSRSSSASCQPTEGTVKDRPAHEIQLRGPGRLQLNEERTVLDEVADGTEFVQWGDAKFPCARISNGFCFPTTAS
jgi:ATP-binding cassette subfamily F protein uup